MDKKILVTFLICLALIVPALGTGVNIYSGVDANIASTGATANGQLVDSYTNNGIVATLMEGLTSDVYIGPGSTGTAYAKLTGRSNTRTETTTPNLNGDKFRLYAEFGQTGSGANVNTGAVKTSAAGVASASSKVLASTSVDNSFVNPMTLPGVKKGLLSGYADISATTLNTGAGTTYALANGQAYYDTRTVNPSGNAKRVNGQVTGSVDLESRNVAVGGSNSGVAAIHTDSSANNYQSYANSKISIDLTSARPGAAGTSTINGYVRNGNAYANAKDASAPASSSAWNVQTTARGALVGDSNDNLIGLPIAFAQAFARGDRATTTGSLTSEAWHDAAGPVYNKVDNKAYAATTVTRSNSRPGTITGAETVLSNGAFSSTSRETNTGNGLARESANSINIESNAQLNSFGFTASNAKTLQLTAWRNNQAQPTHATIRDTARINLPLTGNAMDQSEIEQSAANLLAEATYGSHRASITTPTVYIDAFEDGLTPSAIDDETNLPATAQTGNVVVNGVNVGAFNFVTSLSPNFQASITKTANN